MNETSRHILQKQSDIYYAKPLRERVLGLFEITELSRNIILNQIPKKRPDLNEIELKAELFRALYRFDFDDDTLNRIIKEMKLFILKEQSEKQRITGE